MEMPFGFGYETKGKYVLKLKKNLYGLKSAAATWFSFLCEGLKAENFIQSEVDQCVFMRDDFILLMYVDDVIAISKDLKIMDELVANLKKSYDLEDEGSLTKYLGVDMHKHQDGKLELRQPFLIERILKLLNSEGEKFDSKQNSRPTPAVKPLLFKDTDGPERKCSWNYRQAIGMLTYLQNTTRPDISMAVHQAARFCIDPKLSNERAVKRIGRYLSGNQDKGLIFKPDPSMGVECYVDADFAGGWAKADADNSENVLSRTGFVIFYGGCPLLWASRLQTEITLSTAEAEYVALSSAMREVIALMQLMNEIDAHLKLHNPTPKVFCDVYEDNESCISMATNRKFSPMTKHIAIKYHHFRKFVDDGVIKIHSIDTKEQTADIFTKPLDEKLFEHLRIKLCGW